MQKEIWKTIPEWSDYEASNLGRIRSKDRIIDTKSGYKYLKKGRILKQREDQHGYYQTTLSQNGKEKIMKVHRAVAYAFLSNPDNKPCVNHIDNNPKNNNLENLQWCTLKENSQWMIKQGRAIRTKQWIEKLTKSERKLFAKSVIGINVKTGEEIYFDSLNIVAEFGFQPSCVSCCCSGKRRIHKGYKWKYGSKKELL